MRLCYILDLMLHNMESGMAVGASGRIVIEVEPALKQTLGVGKNMVNAIRYWLIATTLLANEKGQLVSLSNIRG